MRINHTLQLLREGKSTVGTWIQIHSVRMTRMLAAQGCADWLLLDCEHGAVELPTLMAEISAINDISRGRVTPIVRVAAGTIDQIKQALDCGAHGVLVPMVNTPEEAAAVVSYARFPPAGQRGNGSTLAHVNYGASKNEYITQINDQVLVAIQIETREAVENVEQILSVPGIDMVFVGPFDLTFSLGITPGFWSDSPIFQDALQAVMSACRRRGIPVGTFCADAKMAKEREAYGFRFMSLSADVPLLLSALGQQYGEFQNEAEPPEGWAGRLRLE